MRIRGPIPMKRVPSAAALSALQSGDIDALLRAEQDEFGDSSTMMADDPDDDDDDADDDDNPSGDGDDDADKRKKGSKEDDDDDDDVDVETLRRRMKAADKRATAAERKLREQEDAKKDDLQKAQDRVTELESSVTELQKVNRQLMLHNAFLTSNKQTWHDPDTALALAGSKGYLEDVVDEDSGDVDRKALGKALERLAKEHKYLVKEADKQDDEPDSPSGEPAGGRSDNRDDTKAKKKKMQSRFPVLNR